MKNDHLYNDKELWDDADLNWYDYGFRNYDPKISRVSLNKRIEEQQLQIEAQQKLLSEMAVKLEKLLDSRPEKK